MGGGVALPNISFIFGESGIAVNELLILMDDEVYVGDSVNVQVITPTWFHGMNLTFECDGKSYICSVIDGVANINMDGLTAGEKTCYARVSISGTTATGRKSFTVNKRPSTISVTGKKILVGKTTMLTVTVPEGARGRVVVDTLTTREGVPFTRYNGLYGNIVNGSAKISLNPGWEPADVGFYTATVTYEGDDKYLPSTGVSGEFEVYIK